MSQRPIVSIDGIGSAVPAGVLTNADLERTLDTSDQWIVERTGIRERHIARPDETLNSLCLRASRQAMTQANVTPDELDSIIVATITADRRMPSQACDLQAALGAFGAAAFDLSAACPGFLYALTVAEGLVASGTSRVALVLGAEKLSTITDYQDRSTAILFGDGAGAAIVRKSEGDRGLLSTFIKADGRLGSLLHLPGGGSAEPISDKVLRERLQYMKMAGREVFKAAVLTMAEACDEALRRAGMSGADIDLLVPHQANIRIIESTAKHAGIPMDKVVANIDRYGNTSAASIPIALEEAQRTGRLQPGMVVLLVAFGGGFTWGASVVRW
ncbi:MAG: beta-ketoacyl-ACP synthase III [Gemmatimonadota bacterium]